MPLFKTFRKSIRRSKVTVTSDYSNTNGGTCDATVKEEADTDVNGGGACASSINGNGTINMNEIREVRSNGIEDTPLVTTDTPISNGINGTIPNSKTNSAKQKESNLLVVIKDFTGSNKKEMTVHKGQVVQRQYSCGTWINVQNVRGDSGYVPTEVCCPKEEIEDSTWCALNRGESVNGIYENVGPAKPDKPDTQVMKPTESNSRTPPTKAYPYSSMSSTSTSLSRNSSRSTYPDTPHSNGGLQHVKVRKLSTGTPLGVIEYSESPGIPRYSIEHILHPLHPLSITRSHLSSDSQTTGTPTLLGRRSSLDSQPSTPAVQPLLAHNRSDSYLEAVVEKKEGSSTPKVPSLAFRRPSRPADLPMLPLYSNLAQQQKLDTIIGSNNAINTAQHMLESSQTSCAVDDDVFLPSEQKPVGIYEVMKSYNKQTNDEVTVSKGEYVIAMQMGYGQWALVITATNSEGLVPRGHLCRYSPLGRRNKGINIGTQTELIIVAPVVHQHTTNPTSSSSGSTRVPMATVNKDIVCIRDIGPTSTPKKRRGKEMAIQTDSTLSSSCIYPTDSMAWRNDRIDSTDELWYENSMSIPQLPQNNSMFTNEAPSICTLPLLNGGTINPIRGEAPLAFHSSRESLPQFPLRTFIRENQPSALVKQADTFSPITARRTLKEQSDWPLSPGILSNFSSSSPRSPQMVILKATKDFTPDVDGTDYLPLSKGDILHLIPGHNPYKGWLWVNHVRQRCYGYVPKTHVTNACSQELKHRNEVVMYDEV